MPNFTFCGGHEYKTKILVSFPELQFKNKLPTFGELKRDGRSAIKFETAQLTGSPSAICVGSGFKGHLVEFGRNIPELLVYYLMLNKCKNLNDMKSSCLSVCTSSLYDNEGRYFLHYYM